MSSDPVSCGMGRGGDGVGRRCFRLAEISVVPFVHVPQFLSVPWFGAFSGNTLPVLALLRGDRLSEAAAGIGWDCSFRFLFVSPLLIFLCPWHPQELQPWGFCGDEGLYSSPRCPLQALSCTPSITLAATPTPSTFGFQNIN